MDGSNPEAQESVPDPEPSAEEALQRLQLQLRELVAYVSHFVSVKLDELKLSGRQIALWAIIGGLSAVTLISVIVMSVVLILTGCAIGLGVALGHAQWLGQIIVGLGMLGLLAVATLIGYRLIRRQSRIQKVQYYAERQRQQQASFGTSVADRAHGSGS